MKGNIMSNRYRRKPEIVVPGLSYFTPQAVVPATVVNVPMPAELAALEQMFGYFYA
jgi:hypothetical protein